MYFKYYFLIACPAAFDRPMPIVLAQFFKLFCVGFVHRTERNGFKKRKTQISDKSKVKQNRIMKFKTTEKMIELKTVGTK